MTGPTTDLPLRVKPDTAPDAIALGLIQAWADQDIVTTKHLLIAAERAGAADVLRHQLTLAAPHQAQFSADLPETRKYEALLIAHATGLPEAFDQLWPDDIDERLRLLIVGAQLLVQLRDSGALQVPHVQFARWNQT